MQQITLQVKKQSEINQVKQEHKKDTKILSPTWEEDSPLVDLGFCPLLSQALSSVLGTDDCWREIGSWNIGLCWRVGR